MGYVVEQENLFNEPIEEKKVLTEEEELDMNTEGWGGVQWE